MKPLLIHSLLIGSICLAAAAQAAPPQSILAAYVAQAPAAYTPSPERGRTLFASTHQASADLPSCTRCHGDDPKLAGRHAITGKPIAPMAVSANPERLVDAAKTEKWFRRNCREVIGRECSAAEKADVVAYLIGGK